MLYKVCQLYASTRTDYDISGSKSFIQDIRLNVPESTKTKAEVINTIGSNRILWAAHDNAISASTKQALYSVSSEIFNATLLVATLNVYNGTAANNPVFRADNFKNYNLSSLFGGNPYNSIYIKCGNTWLFSTFISSSYQDDINPLTIGTGRTIETNKVADFLYLVSDPREFRRNENWGTDGHYWTHGGAIYVKCSDGFVKIGFSTYNERPEDYNGGVRLYAQEIAGDELALLESFTEHSQVDDPYSPGGESGESSGQGSWDDQQTDVTPADVPSLTTSNAGFYKLYSATDTTLRQLASFMWSATDDVLINIKKLFTDPISCILGLIELPVTPTVSSTTSNVYLGAVNTNVQMPTITNQFVTFNCGSVQLKKYWNNALDYSPYTKAQIILPYVGVQTLDIDELMGKTLTLKYNIDVLTGACVAILSATGIKDDGTSYTTTYYNWGGNCAMQMPITSNDYSNLITTAVSAVGIGVATLATGGLAGAVGVGAGMTLANNVMNSKPQVSHGGGIGGSAGFLAPQKPYIILTRPKQSIPKNYGQFNGYPSNIYSKLGDLTGYTKVEEINLIDMTCTEAEQQEIYRLLKEGVYI